MVRVETGALMVERNGNRWKKRWRGAVTPGGALAGHPVKTSLPDSLPLVPVDELLIEQVFINLLENVIRHTPADTPINISAWPENGDVVVEVADEGDGVPEGEDEAISASSIEQLQR